MWMIIKSAGDEYSFTEVYVEGKIGHTYRYAQILAGEVTAAMKQAVEHKMHPTAFGVCPHGVNLGNQACVACEPEKFGVG